MAITVLQSDTFDEWRIKTNEIASTIASDSFIAGQIADMVNGSNTENGISVSFDTPTATLNFDVDDFTLSLGGDLSGSADITNLNSATLNASINTNFVSSANTSGNGISGSVSAIGGAFTVSSNATASANSNTIMYRNASGDTSVNDITCVDIISSGNTSTQNISAGGTITSSSITASSNITAGGDITANGGDMYATTFHGNATTANYADLAENYRADQEYEVGTVLSFGGSWEVTQSNKKVDTRIAGVVSTEPAYLMNADQQGEFVTPVALMGRVPCKVQGDIRKGDMLVSAGNGRARVVDTPLMGSVIGKALADSDGDNIIEVVVGKL